METATLLYTCLVLHICGFAALTGGLLADITIFSKIDKYISNDRPGAYIILDGASGISRILTIGGLFAICSGVGMVALLHIAPHELIWMKIKLPLVIVLILNAVILARPNRIKLRKLLQPGMQATIEDIAKVRSRIKLFHLSASIILLVIFILSAFKFN
jgi:hypothetical protein